MARMMKKMGKMGGIGSFKNMFSSLCLGNTSSKDANTTNMPISLEEMQKLMGNMPVGNGSNKFGGLGGLPSFTGKPSKRIK